MMILDHYCLSSSSALGNTADGSQEMSFLPSTPKTVLRGPWMKPRGSIPVSSWKIILRYHHRVVLPSL
ncbi:Protein Fam13A [Manis pentadactyla]|nr:Protein Fam13A [Manis pentadactyla]